MKRYLSALLSLICAASAAMAVDTSFLISIDQPMWKKFGFQYPATYVFDLTGSAANVQVQRRDGPTKPWTTLEKKSSTDFFNGVQCVRVDTKNNKVYVSTGFETANSLELKFTGAGSVKFACIAKYYDDRRAAYTLSNDNWGCNVWAHPGAVWQGETNDDSDNYQAALHVCRSFHLPLSIAINSHSAGGEAVWINMQEELDKGDFSWEPAVHGRTHPNNVAAYSVNGYVPEILGCRDDILKKLRNIPYGQHVFEHILTFGYCDNTILKMDSSEFLFLRGFNWLDNPSSNEYVPWNKQYKFYGLGGLNTKGYDTMFQKRTPKGRYYAADVAELNEGFEQVYRAGGVFYALWHPDRFRNSVLYDPSPGVEGECGSTLIQHFKHIANRKDVWYVANGWLYSYRYVAENARVENK